MRNKKILLAFVVLFVAAVSTFMLVGCTKNNVNMLSTESDGTFKANTLSALQSEWELDTETSDTTTLGSVFTVNYDSETDTSTISIDTSTTGWAEIGQKVKLTAGKYYTITFNVTIESIAAKQTNSDQTFDGVFVTFAEDEDFYKIVSTTEDDSAIRSTETKAEHKISFKAKSGGYATLLFKVGSEERQTNAKVTLNKFALEQVDKKSITDQDAYIYTFSTDYYGQVSDFNTFYIVVGAFLIAVLGYAAYYIYQRHLFKSESDTDGYKGLTKKISDSKYLGIIFVVAVACFVRLLTDILSTVVAAGYLHSIMGYNLEGLTTQSMFIAKYGLSDMGAYLTEFANKNSLTYMEPSSSALQLYLLGFCGLLGRMFEKIGFSATYSATMFFIRFIFGLADIGTAILIYIMIKKAAGNMGATIVAGMYIVLPVVFATSALWGYAESVTVFLIVLTVFFMLKNNYIGTAVTFFAACMFSISALFLAPIILFYTILQCIIDVKKIIPASIILVLAFFVFYAINTPFDITFIQNGKPFYCFTRAWNELFKSMLYARNAFNFQTLLGNNFGTISTASTIVTIIFILFLLALVGIAYFKYKNRMNLLLLATAFINMMFIFGNNMNPVSAYMSLAMMLIYAILNKEKRIFFSFIVFSILMFINVSYTELFLAYTSSAAGIVGKTPVMYVFSSIALAFVLYYIYIVYDIVVSRKVRKIKPMPLTYGEWLANTGRRIKKAYYKVRIKLQRK